MQMVFPEFLPHTATSEQPAGLETLGRIRPATPRTHAAIAVKPKQNHSGGHVTEIVSHSLALEELDLLLPVLAKLSHTNRWLTWIDPPKTLPKALLLEAGIDLNKVMILRSDEHFSTERLANMALKIGNCNVVINWDGELSNQSYDALVNAAQRGRSDAVLIRCRAAH